MDTVKIPSAEQKNLKSENTDADSKRKKRFFVRKTILLRRMVTGSRRNISKRMITTAGIPTTNPRKKENTTDGSIRTGNVQNNLILNVISRRRTKPLRKGWNRSFMEEKN